MRLAFTPVCLRLAFICCLGQYFIYLCRFVSFRFFSPLRCFGFSTCPFNLFCQHSYGLSGLIFGYFLEFADLQEGNEGGQDGSLQSSDKENVSNKNKVRSKFLGITP